MTATPSRSRTNNTGMLCSTTQPITGRACCAVTVMREQGVSSPHAAKTAPNTTEPASRASAVPLGDQGKATGAGVLGRTALASAPSVGRVVGAEQRQGDRHDGATEHRVERAWHERQHDER